MPQLDPSSFSSQLFWLTVSFVLLYILLARFLLPRVQSIIEMRAETIGGDITQAERMQSEAERVRDIYEYALAESRTKSKVIIAETRARLADAANRRQAELDAEVEKKLSESEAGIKAAKQEVMGKLVPVATELAEMIIKALVNHKPDAGELDSAIKEFAKRGAL